MPAIRTSLPIPGVERASEQTGRAVPGAARPVPFGVRPFLQVEASKMPQRPRSKQPLPVLGCAGGA